MEKQDFNIEEIIKDVETIKNDVEGIKDNVNTIRTALLSIMLRDRNTSEDCYNIHLLAVINEISIYEQKKPVLRTRTSEKNT